MRKYSIALLFPVLLILTLGTDSHRPLLMLGKLPLRAGLSLSDRVSMDMNQTNLAQALAMYSELTGRAQLPKTSPISQQVDEFFGGYLSRWHIVKRPSRVSSGIEYHRDGLFSVGEVKDRLEALFSANGLMLVPEGKKYFRAIRPSER